MPAQPPVGHRVAAAASAFDSRFRSHGAAMNSDATQGRFADVLAATAPGLRPICKALRAQIAASHKPFVEIVWLKMRIASFGVGPKKMSQHYAYIAAQRSYVNLGFYHGAMLPDPDGLLEGTGKRLRHVKIGDVATASSPAVARLLRRAIADRSEYAHRA